MSANNNTFSDLVRIEQVREIETQGEQELSYAAVADLGQPTTHDFKYSDFFRRLNIRCKRLIDDNALTHALQQPQKNFTIARIVCLVIATILGTLATYHAVNESATLNIYWLLMVLLGFNMLSIVIWTLGITLNLQSLTTGIAAQLVSWLPYRGQKNNAIDAIAARTWRERCLTGTVGKWRISTLTHQFWLIYLAAGIAILILLMMAKQYNFIWGTTLLPDNSLPQLTHYLGAPLQYVGLDIPNNQQIIASRTGSGAQDTQTRTAWANFLIGVLLLYGLLPRLLLLIISIFAGNWAERNAKLDLYLPYYIDLRQRLMTNKIEARIIDADPIQKTPPPTPITQPKDNTLPSNAQAFGIELSSQITWPQFVTTHRNIIDQESFTQAVQLIKKKNKPALIGVALHRLPDRGVQRMIGELTASTTQPCWLILLQQKSARAIPDSRELAWFRLAETCNIPAEHVITQ